MPSFIFPLIDKGSGEVIPILISVSTGDDPSKGARDRELGLEIARSRASRITQRHNHLQWSLDPDLEFSQQSHLFAACLAAAATDWKTDKLPLYVRSTVWATGALDADGSLRQYMELKSKIAAFVDDSEAHLFLVPLRSERQAQHNATKTLSVAEFADKASDRAFWKEHKKVIVSVGKNEIDLVVRAMLLGSISTQESKRPRWPLAKTFFIVVAPLALIVLVLGQTFFGTNDNRPVPTLAVGQSCLDAVRELRITDSQSVATALTAAREIPDSKNRRKCYRGQLTGKTNEVPHTIFGMLGLIEMGASDSEKREMSIALVHVVRDYSKIFNDNSVLVIYTNFPERTFTDAIDTNRKPDAVSQQDWNSIQRLSVLEGWLARLPSTQTLTPPISSPTPSTISHSLALAAGFWQQLADCAQYPKLRGGPQKRPGFIAGRTVQAWVGIYLGGRFAYWNKTIADNCSSWMMAEDYSPCIFDKLIPLLPDASTPQHWVPHSGRRHALECKPSDRCTPVFRKLFDDDDEFIEGVCVSQHDSSLY